MTIFFASPAMISQKARLASILRGFLLVRNCGSSSPRDDRSGDEVGEERHVHEEVERRRRRQLAAVDVDHIADGVEGEEGDADREDEPQERNR